MSARREYVMRDHRDRRHRARVTRNRTAENGRPPLTPADVAAHLGTLENAEAVDRFVRQARLLTPDANVEERPSGLLGQRVKLGGLLRDGIPPLSYLESPTLGDGLFYRDAVWIVSGHKKSGKSWAMAATSLDCARAGRPVVYVDMENGSRLFATRMLLLGADAETVDELIHYVELPRNLAIGRLRDDLEQVAAALPGAFVVMDSLRGLMARLSAGRREPLNPNSHQDVEAVCAPLNDAAKTCGLTVGIIDHAKKGGSDSDEYSTAGAGAKEAAVDAVYFWTKVEKYNREQAGLVKIAATSDRQGGLDFERFYRVGGQGDGPFRFDAADSDEVGTMARIRAAIVDLFADNPGRPFTRTQVAEAKSVKGRAEHIYRALDLVADAVPQVRKEPNPRRRDSWIYTYAPDSDPRDAAGLDLG